MIKQPDLIETDKTSREKAQKAEMGSGYSFLCFFVAQMVYSFAELAFITRVNRQLHHLRAV